MFIDAVIPCIASIVCGLVVLTLGDVCSPVSGREANSRPWSGRGLTIGGPVASRLFVSVFISGLFIISENFFSLIFSTTSVDTSIIFLISLTVLIIRIVKIIPTIKNRMTHIRFWAGNINKPGMIPKSNAELGIDQRVLVTNTNKGQVLDGRLHEINSPLVQMSVRLQAAFGMRREESIKFNPSRDDKGDSLTLEAGTKGGRPRSVPIKTTEQRLLVDECHKLVGKLALIPPGKNFKYQLKVYENTTAKAGFHKLHGLRHQYAQERYERITGWKSPVCGGPKRAVLSSADKQLDNTARQLISRELGHERIEVLAVYIGT